jgi:hypothetical protein
VNTTTTNLLFITVSPYLNVHPEIPTLHCMLPLKKFTLAKSGMAYSVFRNPMVRPPSTICGGGNTPNPFSLMAYAPVYRL